MYISVKHKRICYISGSRADFGLFKSTLALIHNSEYLDLGIIVTGMHLSLDYGETCSEIEEAGFNIIRKIYCDINSMTGAQMSHNIGVMICAMTEELVDFSPDLVVLLGDRGEMLAGAIAAIHLKIPIIHVHGGERSGTIDEPVRHAISKLSHYHLTSCESARERLIKMGENAANIFVVGAPGLDGIRQKASFYSREMLCREIRFDNSQPIALLVFHPVLNQAANAHHQVKLVMDAILAERLQVVALMPNSDAGGDAIRQYLRMLQDDPRVVVYSHLNRSKFLSWMKEADVMVGNSSSAIIESATFGIPAINIGSRQQLRDRNLNVIDCRLDCTAIKNYLKLMLERGRYNVFNIYGDGQAGQRILDFILNLNIDEAVLDKVNEY